MALPVWLPGWDRVDLGPDGGTYDETAHPKACVHTTEGSTLAGAEASYRPYPPHLGYDPVRRIKHQHVALNRYSYAARNGESDDEFMVQVEVVGFAAKTHTWPTSTYANFAEDVIVPLEEYFGVPRKTLKFYRADQGIVLAKKTSPIRLRPAALRAWSGWLGHQHLPGVGDNGAVLASGDDHWDPGGFLMDLAFSLVSKKGNSDMLLIGKVKGQKDVYVSNGVTYRHVRSPEHLAWIQYHAQQNGHSGTVLEFNNENELFGVFGEYLPANVGRKVIEISDALGAAGEPYAGAIIKDTAADVKAIKAAVVPSKEGMKS